MGTNFYMFTKNKQIAEKYAPYSYKLVDDPEFGYEWHVAKTSCGWLPFFQAHENGICSVKQYREAYDTKEVTILDEYGDKYFWDEFDERVLQFNGGVVGVKEPEKVKPLTEEQKKLFGNCFDTSMPEYIPISHFPGTKQSYRYRYADDWISTYKDDDGYEFEKRDFS